MHNITINSRIVTLTDEQYEAYSNCDNLENTKDNIIKKIEYIQTETLTRLNSAFGLKADVLNPAIETQGCFYKDLPVTYNGVVITENMLQNYVAQLKLLNNTYNSSPITRICKTKDDEDVTVYDLPILAESPGQGDFYSLLFLDIRYDTAKIKTIMGWS